MGLLALALVLPAAGCGESDPPPIVVSANAYSPERIIVSWIYTTGDQYARYFLYRDDVEVAVYSYSFQTMQDTGRTEGTEHCYRVRGTIYSGTVADLFIPPGIPDLRSNTACVTTPTVSPWAETSGLAPNADLAVDGDGFVHMAWPEATGFGYGTNRSGTLTMESILLTDPPDGEVAVAVDAGGAAHVAWVRQAAPAGVGYATNAGGGWVTGLIDSGDAYAAAVDIAMHVTDGPQVLLWRTTGHETHASGGPGAWVLTPFSDPLGQLPGALGLRQLKIGVAADGTVHFLRRDSNSLNHATSTDHAWSTRIGVTWNLPLDFAVAPNGTPWVAQWDQAVPPRLTLTTPGDPFWSDTWLHESASEVTVGDVALTIDANGTRHLLFVDDGYVVYANAGQFSRQFISATTASGLRLAAGPDGTLHATWTDPVAGTTVYAHQP